MQLKSLLILFSLLALSLNQSEAKPIKVENLNLIIDLDDNWIEREHQTADFILFNKVTGEAIVIHKQPLSTINSKDQLPNTYEKYKSFVKENFLKSQIEKMADFFAGSTLFYDSVKVKELSGPLVEFSGQTNNTEVTFFMWMPWQGNGAYIVNYVSPKMLQREKQDFLNLVKNIRIDDKQLNPFSTNTNLTLATQAEPIKYPQFNVMINQFNDYFNISATELEIPENENFYNIILMNKNNGDMISTIPHCFTMDEQSQLHALKTVTEYLFEIETQEKSFQSGGKTIKYLSAFGFNSEIKQLSVQSVFKQIQGCNHLILLVTSVADDDSKNIQLVFENLLAINDHEPIIKFDSENQKTAYSNYFITVATQAEEYYLDPLPFYQAAYQVNPNAEVLNLILNYFNTQKTFIEGIELINKASEEIQNTDYIISWHAFFLNETQAYEESIKLYTELFANSYTSDEDFFIFLDILKNNSNWEKAHLIIKDKLNLITKRSTALGQMLKFAAFNKDEPATFAALKIIETENRLNLDNVFDVIDGLYEIEAHQKLTEILNSQIEKHPNNLKLHYYKADIEYSLGQFQAALTSIENAIELAPDNAEVLELQKNIQLNIGVGNYQLINNPIAAVEMPTETKQLISQIPFKNQGDAEFLYYTVGIDFRKNQKLKTTYSKKIKIHNIKGVEQFKTITFDFNKNYEKVYINQFEVLDSDHKLIQKLDIQSVYLSTKHDGITADDDMVINIPVPKLSPGMVINYVITTETISPQTELPYSKHFFISQFPMSMKTVFLTGEVDEIEGISKSKLNLIKNKNLLAWVSDEIDLLTYYPMMPYTEDLSNWLVLNPKDKKWHEVGNDYLNQIADKLNSTISKAKKLAIFAGATQLEDKVIKAASYIQNNINYQALEFGSRALIPNMSVDTLNKGYGDCKDHAVLLYDLLNSEGIEAYIALVQTSQVVNPDTPSLDQFDHAVVYVPQLNGGTFIDTTDKELAISTKLPPQNLQGTKALILTKDQPHLVDIPNAESQDSQIIIDRQISQDLSHLNIAETIQMTGYMASGMRYSLKNSNSSELKQNIQSWLSGEYSELELISFDYYGLSDNQNPLVIELNTRIANDELISGLPFFFERNYLNKNHSNQRDIPYFLNTPFNLSSETSIDQSIKTTNTEPELHKDQSSAVAWTIELNKNKVIFSATTLWQKGSAKDYSNLVKTIKNGLKSLERSIKIEN